DGAGLRQRGDAVEEERQTGREHELSRLVTGAAVLATIPVGTRLNAGAQLAAVVLVLVVMLVVDRRWHAIATGESARSGGPGQGR
ncbi:hypothetical protein ACWEH1_27930, partial [Micromonospora chersina]